MSALALGRAKTASRGVGLEARSRAPGATYSERPLGLRFAPKLRCYWSFHGCGYRKGSRTCAEPGIVSYRSLPRHHLRNGRLNQTAYSLFLFIRDVADGDLVEWIDQTLDSSQFELRCRAP